MRYRAYRHGGLIPPSESERVSDSYDDAPNAWIFGIYVDGELCSSLRLHVLTSEWRTSYSTEMFGDVLHPRLDQGEVFIDPARFVADPEKAQRFPELPYLTVRLAYLACDISMPIPGSRSFVPITRRFIAVSFCTRPSLNRVRFRALCQRWH